MRKQGSLTLSKSTNGHQLSFLSPLQISPWQALANLILPSHPFLPKSQSTGNGGCGRHVESIWKASARSFETILLGEALTAAGAGRAERSAGSLSSLPRTARGQEHAEMVLGTKQRESMRSRAFIWSQLSADFSWTTADSLEYNSCCRTWSLLLCFCHLSNTCGVSLCM